jgi:ATP-dependent protease ClpP protease subunit
VRLRINSPGGDVCEARAMMAAITDHPASFTARIDGLCASAATAITLACDSVEIVDGGFYMIHNAWTCAMGNAADLRATADVLDKVDAVIVAGYMARTKLPEAEVRALMAAETWFTAQEAVERGFCDSVMAIPVGGKRAQARARAAFNLSVYANVPAALVAPPEDTPDPERHRRQMLARLRLFELQA